ncbi:MAG TPA: PAS domain-containing sensor histidine kinase, partial [Candidatus Goldiibacteriota bacterium]|nr:PAS domain-containing sensor histidine kinase [Candidatus Goldiibacteriota bacterium]
RFTGAGKNAAKNGMAAALLDYGALAEKAKITGKEEQIVSLGIYRAEGGRLTRIAGAINETAEGRRLAGFNGNSYYSVPIFCFGRVYIIKCGIRRFYGSFSGFVIMFVGIALSVMLSVFTNFLAKRREDLAREVAEKTRELSESRAKVLSIFNAAPIGIGVVKDRVILEVNPFMTEMTGYKKDEMLGRKSRFLYPSDREFENAGKVKYGMMEMTGRGVVETRWVRKDGREMDILLSSTYIDPAHTDRGVIFTALDITERKLAEANLKKALDEMKNLDAMKNNFISMVSHELRTPLTAIKGFVSLLNGGAAGEMTDVQKEYAGIIEKNAERLLSLMNEILDISRMESGKFTINQEECELRSVIEDSVREIKSIAEKRGIKIDFMEGQEYRANIDKYRISQVMTNLLGNSIKFSPENSVISVNLAKMTTWEVRKTYGRAPEDMKEGPCFCVSVKDRGRGIKQESIDKLFSRFYQINDGDSKVYKGVGLGLNICRQIVEMHGGRIWAESGGEGKGSEFIFVLPA